MHFSVFSNDESEQNQILVHELEAYVLFRIFHAFIRIKKIKKTHQKVKWRNYVNFHYILQHFLTVKVNALTYRE